MSFPGFPYVYCCQLIQKYVGSASYEWLLRHPFDCFKTV
jgi:hypothetical protein